MGCLEVSLEFSWGCGRRRSQSLDEFRHVLQCAAVILVVLKQSGFDVWGSSFVPSLPPDYGVQSRGIFVCAFESEKPANVFQAIGVRAYP